MKSEGVILVFLAITNWATASAIQKRIKLIKKGHYPDRPTTTPQPLRDNSTSIEGTLVPIEDFPSFIKTTKPESLEGWLKKPKSRSDLNVASSENEDTIVKEGFCEHSVNYGIRCGGRMDQCDHDADCPGVTKCCLVSDCGFLCVKPKAKLKNHILRKKIGKESLEKEAVTTAEGLKIEDITRMPKRE